MPVVDFEKDVGPVKIKGIIDEKAGQIKGEIGTTIPGIGYKSIKPFAGSIKDGVHGSFKLGAALPDCYFGIKVKDHAVKAQINLPDKGHEITIFELEATVQGEIRFPGREQKYDADFKIDGSPYSFQFSFSDSGFDSALKSPFAKLTYRSRPKLVIRQTIQGTIEQTNYSFTLEGGEKIEGHLPEPIVSETTEVYGHGSWNPPKQGGSSLADEFGEGRVGQPQGDYDGIALPKVGFGG